MIYQLFVDYDTYNQFRLTDDCIEKVYERSEAARKTGIDPKVSISLVIDRLEGSWFTEDDLPKPDITFISGMLAFSTKAFGEIQGVLPSSAKVIPCSVENETWHVLDLGAPLNSAVKEISSEDVLYDAEVDESVVAVIEFHDQDNLPSLFHIEFEKLRFYCADTFVTAIQGTQLTGLLITPKLTAYDLTSV